MKNNTKTPTTPKSNVELPMIAPSEVSPCPTSVSERESITNALADAFSKREVAGDVQCAIDRLNMVTDLILKRKDVAVCKDYSKRVVSCIVNLVDLAVKEYF